MTLKEVAAEIGVSPSIVSRVLNGYTRGFSISDELRRRILQKVQECGYHANPVFSAIKQKKNRQIAILYYSPSPKSTGLTMDDMIDEASLFFQAQGYLVNFTFENNSRTDWSYQPPPWKVSGVLIPDCVLTSRLAGIENAGIPYVCMNGVSSPNGTSVRCDEKDGMTQILEYLQRQGHRKVVLLQTGNSTDAKISGIGGERYEAFYSLAPKMGLEPDHLSLLPTRGSVGRKEELRRIGDVSAVAELFEKGITAAVCTSEVCHELFYHVHQLGKRIPEDLSVVAYNDEEVLRWMNPPVTVFHVPGREMGTLAAELLFRKITENPDCDRGVTHFLKGKLIVRESVRICGGGLKNKYNTEP